MSAIIYQKTPGALIAQPGRTVATFSSGLCRVDQTFIGLTSQEPEHRVALAVGNDFPGDASPSTVPLKIFPEAQEIRRGDGFTEFRVSGYGSTLEGGSNIQYFSEFTNHDFIADIFSPGYINSPLFGAGDLTVAFTTNYARGEIVGNLYSGGGVNIDIPIDELDVSNFSVSSGWTIESQTNDFTSANSQGNFSAVLRWQTNNSDGTPKLVRLSIQISRVSWVIESARSYGAIGEYTVLGTRSVIPITDLNLTNI